VGARLVSCRDLVGTEHAVEVTAESLYEAVAQAWGILRGDIWVEEIGEGLTELKVRVNQAAHGRASCADEGLSPVAGVAGPDARRVRTEEEVGGAGEGGGAGAVSGSRAPTFSAGDFGGQCSTLQRRLYRPRFSLAAVPRDGRLFRHVDCCHVREYTFDETRRFKWHIQRGQLICSL
jgi:hypothetical protein